MQITTWVTSLFVIVLTSACAASSQPIATLAVPTPTPSAVIATQTTTTALPHGEIVIRDLIESTFRQANITLLDMKSSLKDRRLSVYVAPLNKQHTNQAAAFFAMGILVKTLPQIADVTSRPQTLIVLYDSPDGKKIRRMTLSEPTISSVLEGKINLDAAEQMIKIEESAD